MQQYTIGQRIGNFVYAGLARSEEGQPDRHLFVDARENADFVDVEYGTYGKTIDANRERDGLANTKAMAEEGSQVAKDVLALEVDGHKDLYIPARRELALCQANVAELFEKDWYFSSSQSSAHGAWIVDFDDGYQYIDSKDDHYRVRAVRSESVLS